MYLLRKLFGEILPFRMDHRRGGIPLKGGLADDHEFFESDSVTLFQTSNGRLEARVIYSDNVPEGLHSPSSGSARWFHDDMSLKLRVVIPNGFHYDFRARMLSAPDYFLNAAGRPERHPPSLDDPPSFLTYRVEITDNRWWSSDENSPGREWYFSVNDLPDLPSLRESKLCEVNTAPGAYPGAYFTCTLDSVQYGSEPVEYWFSYELESTIDRVNSFRDEGNFVIEKNQYRFCFGRTDKRELEQNEGRRIVDLWEYLLGFCSGTFRTVDIVIGYNDTGGWSYVELPRPLARQFSCKSSWFPQKWTMDFPAFASQFLSHFQHDYDQYSKDNDVPANFYDPALPFPQGLLGVPIPILDGYLRAAVLELPHDALNASFAILESVVKQHLGRADGRSLRDGELEDFLRKRGIPPIERNWTFGSYQNGAWQSPKEIVGLQDRPEGATIWITQPKYKELEFRDPSNPEDPEYGITDIKAWRDKRASHFDAHAGGGTFYDIQNYSHLTLEYLELAILQMIGYTGMYRSRIGMFDKAVKQVPWADSLEESARNQNPDDAISTGNESVAD